MLVWLTVVIWRTHDTTHVVLHACSCVVLSLFIAFHWTANCSLWSPYV